MQHKTVNNIILRSKGKMRSDSMKDSDQEEENTHNTKYKKSQQELHQIEKLTVRTSHTRTSPSAPPVATKKPPGCTHTEFAPEACTVVSCTA